MNIRSSRSRRHIYWGTVVCTKLCFISHRTNFNTFLPTKRLSIPQLQIQRNPDLKDRYHPNTHFHQKYIQHHVCTSNILHCYSHLANSQSPLYGPTSPSYKPPSIPRGLHQPYTPYVHSLPRHRLCLQGFLRTYRIDLSQRSWWRRTRPWWSRHRWCSRWSMRWAGQRCKFLLCRSVWAVWLVLGERFGEGFLRLS